MAVGKKSKEEKIIYKSGETTNTMDERWPGPVIRDTRYPFDYDLELNSDKEGGPARAI